jgi:VWFA-related protein
MSFWSTRLLLRRESGWLVLLLIVWHVVLMPVSAAAEKRMTVAQLEKLLIAEGASKNAGKLVQQIADMELSERLTQPTLERLRAHLDPGSPVVPALQLLADQSAFLDPPANELPATAPPDGDRQARMLEAVRQYVAQTLPNLPNFLATRVIDLYDDRPWALKKGDWPVRAGLHLVGTSTGEISVRNERENQPATQGSSVWQEKIGLISGGEFGNTLGMIFVDTARGKIAWSHWETTSTGTVAVFHYEVPASASHYEVISTLRREPLVQGVDTPGGGPRGIRGIGTRPNVNGSNVSIVHTKPGYHGEISVNPADGTVLRVTMDADVTKGPPFRRAAILVEYGPVEIGGSTFLCPVRSLALSMSLFDTKDVTGDTPTEWLNETRFVGYHRFASTSRMVAENGVSSSGAPGQAPTSAQAEGNVQAGAGQTATQTATSGSSSAGTPEAKPEAPATAEAAKAEAAKAEAPAASVANRDASAPVTSSAPIAPAQTQTAAPAEGIPAAGAQAASPPDTGITLRVEVPEVPVPVVVLDRQGHAVGGLTKADFTVLDGGKPRDIVGFTEVKATNSDSRPGVPSAGAADVAETRPVAQNRFLVFLFDDRHLNNSDLSLAQSAAIKTLDESLGAGEYADVLSFMGVDSGFSQDRAALEAAVRKVSVHLAAQHGKGDCPDVDYFAADRIINKHDATEFQIAVRKARDCSGIQMFEASGSSPASGIDNANSVYERMAASAATHALAAGEDDARLSLASIENVVRAMAKLPGQRTLILVSPGFLSLSPDAMNFKSQIFDQAAAANVVINALDARGLYAGNVGASEGGSAVFIEQISGTSALNHLNSMQASEYVMGELAAGTGGTFFHNSNDLEGGLKSLAAAPAYLYLLQISVKDAKKDGAYHSLQVKVDKPGLQVRARKGYVAARPEKPRK